jgi:hypothetical protein
MGLNANLAAKLGRVGPAFVGGPAAIMDPYSNPQNTVGPTGSLAGSVSLDTGRISAGLVGALVLGAAGFYIWTRRFQS